MSIVALKKKAHALWDSHSRGSDGFSLHGKTRFTSGVGANLGKSVTRTPFKGAEPVGHGGGPRCRVAGYRARVNHCDGEGYLRFVANSGTCSTPQVLVKPAVQTTAAMIEARYMGILHGTYPRTWVQPQQASNTTLKEKRAAVAAACKANSDGTGSIEWTRGCGPYTKPAKLQTVEEHLLRLTAECKSPPCHKVPFPIPFTSRVGCTSFYATWQEAQKAGLLCAAFKG
jgi:hypothetical protein